MPHTHKKPSHLIHEVELRASQRFQQEVLREEPLKPKPHSGERYHGEEHPISKRRNKLLCR